MKIFIVILLTYIFSISNLYSQVTPQKNTNKLSWGSSFYFSTGYGMPQGLRFELGYNIENAISLGLTFGISDEWSRNPSEGMIGVNTKLHLFPLGSTIGYIQANYGGTIAFLGESDTYTSIMFGAKIPLKNGIQLCPEIGWVFTSRHIRGGNSLFGGSSPVISEEKTRLGFNLSLEYDFAHL